MVTSADELTMSNWSTTTKSGMSALLCFEDDTAVLTVFDCAGQVLTKIKGAFAADNENFYITDTNLCKTFVFGYKVFGDRAELEYENEILVFYPVNEHKTGVSEIEKTE